jgi:AAA family ATP:ADP antiporter
MFAYAFLAMTAYNIIKPITRSKLISDLGADNLPYAQLAAGLLIGALMDGYDRFVARLPPRWGIPVTQTALAAVLLGFWPLFLTRQAWASAAFFVFGMMMGVLVISQFWTPANDVFDSRQARRLFGLIGGGASLGGATGATVTRLAVTHLGTDNLLPVSAATLLLCAGLKEAARATLVGYGDGVVDVLAHDA